MRNLGGGGRAFLLHQKAARAANVVSDCLDLYVATFSSGMRAFSVFNVPMEISNKILDIT